jgi:hypothetical protein
MNFLRNILLYTAYFKQWRVTQNFSLFFCIHYSFTLLSNLEYQSISPCHTNIFFPYPIHLIPFPLPAHLSMWSTVHNASYHWKLWLLAQKTGLLSTWNSSGNITSALEASHLSWPLTYPYEDFGLMTSILTCLPYFFFSDTHIAQLYFLQTHTNAVLVITCEDPLPAFPIILPVFSLPSLLSQAPMMHHFHHSF